MLQPVELSLVSSRGEHSRYLLAVRINTRGHDDKLPSLEPRARLRASGQRCLLRL